VLFLDRLTRAKRLAQRADEAVAVMQAGLDEQRRRRAELSGELAQAQATLRETQQLHARDAVHIEELETRVTALQQALSTARRLRQPQR
jgi:capsule polysaccharide export protein KpsE/RkpR